MLGGHGFDPRSGKIPPTAEQLSPCATTSEPAVWRQRLTARVHTSQLLKPAQCEHLEPVLHDKRNRCSEKPEHCSKE